MILSPLCIEVADCSIACGSSLRSPTRSAEFARGMLVGLLLIFLHGASLLILLFSRTTSLPFGFVLASQVGSFTEKTHTSSLRSLMQEARCSKLFLKGKTDRLDRNHPDNVAPPPQYSQVMREMANVQQTLNDINEVNLKGASGNVDTGNGASSRKSRST